MSVSKNTEQRGLSYVAGGSSNWFSQSRNPGSFYITTTLGAIPLTGIDAIEISAYVQLNMYNNVYSYNSSKLETT